jgi:hypothetical protein
MRTAGRKTIAGVAGCARVRRSSRGDGKIGGDAFSCAARVEASDRSTTLTTGEPIPLELKIL